MPSPLYLSGRYALLTAFLAAGLGYGWRWFALERAAAGSPRPRAADVLIGFGTNFFDTLGIGCFAPTTAIFKMQRRMADEDIPGTLNVGHALPTVVEALVFVGRAWPTFRVPGMSSSAMRR